MRILVTGATGAIGRNLIKELKQETSHTIRILTRTQHSSEKDTKNFENTKGDLADIESLSRACADVDTIIHLAGITHAHNSSLYDKINRVGSENLIHAAERAGIKRFIFLSSKTASYSGGAYAESKIRVEESLADSQLNWVIVRPAEVYGLDKNDSVQKLIDFLKKGYPCPIIGKGHYRIAPVSVNDVINGLMSIIDNDESVGNTYIFQGPKDYTFVNFLSILERKLGKKIVKLYLPVFLIRALAYVCYLFRSDMLYRDQIPRLLCKKDSDGMGSFSDLGIKPTEFDQLVGQLVMHD